MIRPPTLEYIDGEYTIVERPIGWRLVVRRVGCWLVIGLVVLCAVLIVAAGW